MMSSSSLSNVRIWLAAAAAATAASAALICVPVGGGWIGAAAADVIVAVALFGAVRALGASERALGVIAQICRAAAEGDLEARIPGAPAPGCSATPSAASTGCLTSLTRSSGKPPGR